jgi:Fe2+ or Zn2+ uptake regulation protein
MPQPTDSCQQLATAIESYLSAHPAAADSAKGVAEWWILGMGLKASINDVRRALELLMQRGVVEVQVMGDKRKVYRACRNRPGAAID